MANVNGNVAVVCYVSDVSYTQLVEACAAIQKQVTQHLQPFWGVGATVTAYRAKNEVPAGRLIAK
jgi:hypothetical protein